MIYALILVVTLSISLILVQMGLIPRFIKSESDRLRSQVKELAVQLRGQLDRVEAQQRSVTESMVALRSFTFDKPLSGDSLADNDAGRERHFLNALVRELSDRLGGRIWLVEDTGRVVGDAASVNVQHLLSEGDLPMAIPLRSLLAQSGEGLRHTTFRSASGSHTLVVQRVKGTPWMLAIDMPTRRLGEHLDIMKDKPWPLAVLLLVSTLTLLRGLSLHLERINEALPTLKGNETSTPRGNNAQLTRVLQEIGEHVAVISRAAIYVAQQNEKLLQKTAVNVNRIAMLADSVSDIVEVSQALYESGTLIADSSESLVQLTSRIYSFTLHNEDSVLANESQNLAQHCARSFKEIRVLLSDAIMQGQGEIPQDNSDVLIEEVCLSASTLLQRINY